MADMASSKTNGPRLADRDWTQLTLGQCIQHLEVEGYVVLPQIIDAEHVARLKEQTAQYETNHVDYSVHQRGKPSVQFTGGAISELIAYALVVEFLKALCGDDIILMSYDYTRSEPGHPGISLHCDGQPWGAHIFGAEYTCPKLVRVLYYLDDLIPEVSPFRVVPRTHLSYHNQANPYLRYEEHPEEVMVTCKAGSVVIFSHNIFHGNYPNVGEYARESLQLSYRPTLGRAGRGYRAVGCDEVAKLSPAVQELMGDRGQRIWIPEGGNKPPNMPRVAPGINPSRWERD